MTWNNLPQILTAIGTVLGAIFLLIRWLLKWRSDYDRDVWKRSQDLCQIQSAELERLRQVSGLPKVPLDPPA
jgi:hypothetical protein